MPAHRVEVHTGLRRREITDINRRPRNKLQYSGHGLPNGGNYDWGFCRARGGDHVNCRGKHIICKYIRVNIPSRQNERHVRHIKRISNERHIHVVLFNADMPELIERRSRLASSHRCKPAINRNDTLLWNEEDRALLLCAGRLQRTRPLVLAWPSATVRFRHIRNSDKCDMLRYYAFTQRGVVHRNKCRVTWDVRRCASGHDQNDSDESDEVIHKVPL